MARRARANVIPVQASAPALPERNFRDLLGNEIAARVKPTRDYVAHFFKSALHGKTEAQIAALMTNDFRNVAEYLTLLDGGKTCQRFSLLYNPHRLSTRSHQDGKRAIERPSIMDALLNDKFYDGLARAYLAMYADKGNLGDLLYSMIQVGIQGSVYINEFPPHVARDIYREFKLGKSSRILDPCAGWGGRMIGASVVSNHYDGVEPATNTNAGLRVLGARLTELTSTFNPRVICKPFEDVKLPRNAYDFALTSPPYYDTEIYSDEDTNSLNRYQTFETWVAGFYKPFITKTIDALKPGASFVLNIGDRKYPLPNVMREHCEDLGVEVRKLPSRLAHGGGLRSNGEGEVFFILTKPRE